MFYKFSFNFQIYCILLASVLSVSAFLYFSRLPAKICKRSFLRQTYEMLLLISLEPRVSGIIKEKNNIARIIITVAILMGLLMRKNFCAQISAVFAIQKNVYISDLKNLKADPSIKTILIMSEGSKEHLKVLLKNPVYHNLLNKYKLEAANLFKDNKNLKELFKGDAVYLYMYDYLVRILAHYPFMNAKVTALNGVFGNFPFYYFPIAKSSKLYLLLYKW